MKSFQFVTLVFLLLFQGISAFEPSLLDKERYYKECLESLNHLEKTYDYNQLLANVENHFKITSHHSSLEQSVIEFAQFVLKRPISSEELLSLNGRSGNPVFKVYSLVIKAFRGGDGEFSKEFLTLQTYHQNTLPDLKFSQVRGIGAFQVGEDRYFLLGMQYIEGVPIDNLFDKAFHLKQSSEERNDLIRLLQRIYRKKGKGLAQFHYQKSEVNCPIPSFHLKALERLSYAACAVLNSRQEGGAFLAKQIREVTTSNKWSEITSQRFNLGYMHRDVHPGNFIVNLDSEELFLIDTGRETVGPKGEPIGLPFLDVAVMQNQIYQRKIWGLSDQEADLLYSSFKEGYKSETLHFPTEEQMTFFQIIDMLDFFVWYDRAEKYLDAKNSMKDVYQYALKKCLSIIEDFQRSSSE